MKNMKLFLLLMAFGPWIFIPLLGKNTLKRFLPGSIFMVVYLIFEGILAERRKWWWFPLNVKPNVLAELPLIIGPFFVGSLWIFKYTYGKFKLYLLINIFVDTAFTYFILSWFKKIGYSSLVRLSRFKLSFVFLIKSFLMYGFQYWYEKTVRKHTAVSRSE